MHGTTAFSSADAAAVVVIRLEDVPEDRVSVCCWNSAPTAASAASSAHGERTVALLVTAPAGGGRQAPRRRG